MLRKVLANSKGNIMRLLGAREWAGVVGSCSGCGIRVLIETGDVMYSLTENSFCVDCPVCGKQNLLHEDNIPTDVQVAVKLMNNSTIKIS